MNTCSKDPKEIIKIACSNAFDGDPGTSGVAAWTTTTDGKSVVVYTKGGVPSGSCESLGRAENGGKICTPQYLTNNYDSDPKCYPLSSLVLSQLQGCDNANARENFSAQPQRVPTRSNSAYSSLNHTWVKQKEFQL